MVDIPDVPEVMVCPISQEPMTDPVMDREGHNFDRSSIAAWLQRHKTCPLGRCAADIRPGSCH